MLTLKFPRILAVSACLGMAPVFTSAQPTPVMPEEVFPGLRQSLDELAKQSPRMVARNLDLLAAEGDLQQAKSGLYPSLSGYYRPTWGNQRREGRPDRYGTDKLAYSLNLTQPIFHWGEKVNLARIGEIRRAIADDNYAVAYQQLAQDVRVAYLQLAIRKVQLSNARFSRGMADAALRVAEERLAKREISEGAIFQTRMAAEQAALTVETAEWDFTVAKQNLAQLTGADELADHQIPDGIPGVRQSFGEVQRELGRFLAQAERNTPRLRASHQQIEVNRLTYKNARTRLRPKLSFIAGVTQDEQSYSLDVAAKYGVEDRFVGLQVTWSIFDGFATRGAVTSSLARYRQAQHTYKELNETVARDAQREARAVDLAQRQMAISDRLLSNAQNFLDFRQEDLRRGQASETEVNAAQAAYNVALNTANASRYNYIMRVANFMTIISEGDVTPPAPIRN